MRRTLSICQINVSLFQSLFIGFYSFKLLAAKELVNIGLAVQPPTPTALAATVGPVLNSKGEVLRKERRAEFKSAVTENHQPDLTPLFETENIRGPRRRR